MTNTTIHYAIIYSAKSKGKPYTEMTNGVETIQEAIDDARELRVDGKRPLGLIQIDLLGEIAPLTIQSCKTLRQLFDAEEDAAQREEEAVEDEERRYGSYEQQHRLRSNELVGA